MYQVQKLHPVKGWQPFANRLTAALAYAAADQLVENGSALPCNLRVEHAPDVAMSQLYIRHGEHAIKIDYVAGDEIAFTWYGPDRDYGFYFRKLTGKRAGRIVGRRPHWTEAPCKVSKIPPELRAWVMALQLKETSC